MNKDAIWDIYFNPVTLTTLSLLEETVLLGGHGDHLEIGTLFGGSAIATAMLKVRHGFSGQVFCIDPWDWNLLTSTMQEHCVCPPSPEIVMANAQLFGVADRVRVFKGKSNPLPGFQANFSTAYIDGDHTHKAVSADWYSVFPLVSKAVLFDDLWALTKLLQEQIDPNPEWTVKRQDGMALVIRR